MPIFQIDNNSIQPIANATFEQLSFWNDRTFRAS